MIGINFVHLRKITPACQINRRRNEPLKLNNSLGWNPSAAGLKQKGPDDLASPGPCFIRAGRRTWRLNPPSLEKAQLAQIKPLELTGIKTPLPMYCNSTADPMLPVMLLVVVVLGSGVTLEKNRPPLMPLTVAALAAILLPSGDIHAPVQYWLVAVSAVQEAP